MELPSNSFFSNNSLSVPYSVLPSSLCEYTAASGSFPSEYFFSHIQHITMSGDGISILVLHSHVKTNSPPCANKNSAL